MPSISDIVNVTVVTQSAQVKQANFGIPLILDYHTKWPERIRFYSDTAGMLADTFTVNDAAYKAASAMFAQNPQLDKLAIGRRLGAPDLEVRLIPTAVNLTQYQVRVIGPGGITGTASYTSDATATVAEITAGLTSAINALAAGVTATDATTHVTVKAPSPGTWFAVEALNISLIDARQVHAQAATTVLADLAAIAIIDNSWYGITMTTGSKAEIQGANSLSAFAEANQKLAIMQSQDGDIPGTAVGGTDVADDLKMDGVFRTALIFHPNSSQFAGAAWLGATFPHDPGGLTFAFRQLAGVSSTVLTTTHITNMTNKNANWYADYGGIALTQTGKVAQGEWIDIIRDRDWYKNLLETYVFALLANSLKVPFTDAGIAAVENQVRKATREAILAGFLVEGSDVYVVPTAASVSPIDKAARHLKTVKVQATIAGAIHLVNINATVSV